MFTELIAYLFGLPNEVVDNLGHLNAFFISDYSKKHMDNSKIPDI